jgi:DNA-binding transcriptional LysR family regulator
MRPTIDLERLRTFYTAAKSRKFNAAAGELGIDSSSVTRQIQALERDLNCILFERGGFRGLQLTEKGKILQEIAHSIFSSVAGIEPAFSKVDNKMEGPLKICVHGSYSLNFLYTYIYEFMEKYPLISIEILTTLNPLDITLREVDIVISHNLGEKTEELIKREFFTYTLKLYASKKYLDKYGTPKEVKDLENHRFVSASDPDLRFFPQVNWYLNLIPGITLEPYFATDSNLHTIEATEKGMGIGSLSAELFNRNNKDLVPVLPEIIGPKRTIVSS